VQVLHLAAESTSLRGAVFRAAAEEVCSAAAERRSLKHQLGISRRFLQITAIAV
jgi:hypothetical protein